MELSEEALRNQMRLLTKSRFKLGLECPNKLFFTGKDNFANKKSEDTFLAALANGGFQVEELARVQYPGGILINSQINDYKKLAEQTAEALKNGDVTLFEAAFLTDGYFIRTDILEKKGNQINLIEVKAKSFDSTAENVFLGERGIQSKWKPYLFDLAFQKMVAQMAYPNFKFKAHLMLADKSKRASIDGLNQMFRIPKVGNKRVGIKRMYNDDKELGASVLTVQDVDSIINSVLNNQYGYIKDSTINFDVITQLFRDAYTNDRYYGCPTQYSACKKCEFKCSEEDKSKGLLSGFEYCFQKQHDWTQVDFLKPNVFEIWKLKGDGLMNNNLIFLDQISKDHLKYEEKYGVLSTSQRQWIQVEKSRSGDESIFVLKDELKNEMLKWVYPLHFIDFETSAVALPFTKGRRPYEQVAFQFSHHIYHQNGTIEHNSQYINANPGEFPNFKFTRELKKSLSEDNGTIFKYASHENSILNAIYNQLKDSNELDREELMEFIKTISKSREKSLEKWVGNRNMVDLKDIVQKYYYNPFTKGSNSLKAVLPAILKSSTFLREKYSRPIRENGIKSLNFNDKHIWLDLQSISPDPYKSLPKLFDDWSEEEIESTLSDMDKINEGGAALTAYSKLQYVDMENKERNELVEKLLKYCELDTLAMVMLYEHFLEITS